MRAAVVEQLGAPLVVGDVPDPECPPDGAIIEVGANGVCRTDWALWAGEFWAGGPEISPPFVLGHEFAGTIEEVGSEVRDWRPGQRVTFPMNPGEGSCEMCRAGQSQVCEHQATLVPGVSYWGAFAEYVAVRFADVNLVALPEAVDFGAAAGLGCRYIAAFHGIVDQAAVRGGEWVAIYGAGGGVGLSAVQVAAAIGAEVIAVDIDEGKLSTARAVGAAHTVDARREDPAAAIVELTGGGAQVSVDAAGLAETCRASLHSLRNRGRHLQLGHTLREEGAEVAVPIDLMLIKELEFVSAFGMAAHRFAPMLEMFESGRLDPGAVVTDRVALEDATAALESVGSYDSTGIVVIDRF